MVRPVGRADAGLLDGRPATTHWALVEQCKQRYPRVRWQPERFVTESGNIFCGGGVYAAIDLSLYGDSVYVVNTVTDAAGKPVRRAERRAVTLGEQDGNRVAVVKGLKPGEEVVVAGQLKLQNNSPVLVDNTIALRPDVSQTLK